LLPFSATSSNCYRRLIGWPSFACWSEYFAQLELDSSSSGVFGVKKIGFTGLPPNSFEWYVDRVESKRDVFVIVTEHVHCASWTTYDYMSGFSCPDWFSCGRFLFLFHENGWSHLHIIVILFFSKVLGSSCRSEAKIISDTWPTRYKFLV
jgi:hypothetical protein